MKAKKPNLRLILASNQKNIEKY